MEDNDHRKAAAREELERRRSRVRTSPKPEAGDLPGWLKEGVEEMRGFFNSTADVWDSVFGTEKERPLYEAVAQQIAPSSETMRILVLGCGTGLELEAIFEKMPDAQVMGIDLAPNMLAQVRRKFNAQAAQIELIEASYVGLPLGEGEFVYVVATLPGGNKAEWNYDVTLSPETEQ